jgi:hypothetical protein
MKRGRQIIIQSEEERKDLYRKKHSRHWEKCFLACVSMNTLIFGLTYMFHNYLERISGILFLVIFSNAFASMVSLERIITKSARFNLKQGIKPEVMGAFRYSESYKFPWGGLIAGGIAGFVAMMFYLILWH